MTQKKVTRKALRHLRKLAIMHAKEHKPFGKMVYIVALDKCIDLTVLKYPELNEDVFLRVVQTLKTTTESQAGKHILLSSVKHIINTGIKTQW